MKIYPETLRNLELCLDWISSPEVAKKRGLHNNGVNTSLGCMVRNGLLEKRSVDCKRNAGGLTYMYEYKVTEKGLDVLYPAFRAKKPLARGSIEKVETDNPFQWRTYVQPIPLGEL